MNAPDATPESESESADRSSTATAPAATTPAQTHATVAGTFTDRVRGTTNWDAPAPPKGWVARDVVRHLVTWFPAFVEGRAGIRLTAGPDVDTDPVAAWQVHSDAVQALLDDPATAGRVLSNPNTGDVPLDVAVDMFYTADVFMHTWDIARATGQDETLDADRCAQMLAGMEPMDAVLRSSGQYGPRVDLPAGADVQSRLLAFIGRDPRT